MVIVIQRTWFRIKLKMKKGYEKSLGFFSCVLTTKINTKQYMRKEGKCMMFALWCYTYLEYQGFGLFFANHCSVNKGLY